ncbi:tRNA-splicing_ligase RtcB [Hexamita inflata]|uniref:3'-phosphate/5'-hydroxy nucleic acid ligase n=1 Tax=Hexamita inflata TaxID=28002 RepID=A0AA86RWS3_9EUKA|nr:tRNA-splicing ligase RtcB [Hexamita inflata]
MQYVSGKYGDAQIFTNTLDDAARKQIQQLCDHKLASDANIRVMPDVHVGANCVIGFTSKLTKYLVPDLIGTDIGCGVSLNQLGFALSDSLRVQFFTELDQYIKDKVPIKTQTRNVSAAQVQAPFKQLFPNYNYNTFYEEVTAICKQLNLTVYDSLGTLGGGNHFIEIDEGEQLWITVHSGSRDFGKAIAEHYQSQTADFDYEPEKLLQELNNGGQISLPKSYENIFKEFLNTKVAKKLIDKLMLRVKITAGKSQMGYLTGKLAENYVHDMKIAQMYAQLNRKMIMTQLLKFCDEFQQKHSLNKSQMHDTLPSYIESVHNYIDYEDNVIRKGAIRAHSKEAVVVPLNMKAGVILGFGKSNEEWNNSAPHGAGRLIRRSDVNKYLSLDEFKKLMNGVFTTCVNQYTLDESPGAYKNPDEIVELVGQTIDIIQICKSVYNFKAGGD